MLEILAIISLSKMLSRAAAEKGRSGWWAALGVGFWVLGELMGAIVAGILGVEGFAIYGMALLAAGIGFFIAYLVVKALPPLEVQSTPLT